MSMHPRRWFPALTLFVAVAALPCTAVSCAERQPPVSIAGAKMPVEGLITAGQPTPEELAATVRAGYRTVINLRTASESGFAWEQEAVEKLGARYVWIPVAGADGLTRENVERLDTALEDGMARGGVLLHCASGNRVGALLALRAAWLQHEPAAEALRFGLSAGLTRLEPATRKLLEEKPAPSDADTAP